MGGGSNRGRKSRAPKKPGARGRGRPSTSKDGHGRPPSIAECFLFRCTEVLERLKKKDHYNIFLKPVNPDQVAGYRETVKNPMDFSTMGKKLKDQHYKSLGEFRRDLDLIWSNCLLFNGAEPNNVFSKKAIELRKVTERLIASTRSSLEKDKEELYRWKERQRQLREQRAGLAAGMIGNAQNPGIPGLNLALALSGGQGPGGPTLDSPIPGAPLSANGHQERVSPQAAFNFALKQLLRVQYGSNTGLYKQERQGSLPQHYIAPDGSAVNIPSVRYEPNRQHWGEYVLPINPHKRKLDMPDAVFNRLEPVYRENPCHPLLDAPYVKVKDFVDSVRSFVGNAGEIPNKIVDEFLAPELAVRERQESKRRKVMASQTSAAAALSSGLDSNSNCLTSSDAPSGSGKPTSSSVHKSRATDALMNSCKVSIFPKVTRKIAELDGEEGLEHLIGPELAEEVRNVPVTAVDFAMPYGLNQSALLDVLRLVMDPRLGLDPGHVRALDEVRRATDETVAKMSPRFRSMHGGASVLSSQEIHDAQMAFSRQAQALTKSIVMQQTQVQAQKQREAQVMAESLRKRNAESMVSGLRGGGDQLPSIVSVSPERRLQEQQAKHRQHSSFQARNSSFGTRAPTGGSGSTAAAIANVLGHTTPIPTAASSTASLQNTFMKIASGQMQSMHKSIGVGNAVSGSGSSQGGSNMRGHLSYGNNGHGLGQNPFLGAGSSQGLLASVGIPGVDLSRRPGAGVACSNCGMSCGQGWRLGGPSGKEKLCNTCGVHWDRQKSHRAVLAHANARGKVSQMAAAHGAPSVLSVPAVQAQKRSPPARQPGTGRFAPRQNGGIHKSSLAMQSPNASACDPHLVGASRGMGDHIPGLQVPLAGMMNSIVGNHQNAGARSQIGKEIDNFSIPGLHRPQHGSQAENVHNFPQMNRDVGPKAMQNSIGGQGALGVAQGALGVGQPGLASSSLRRMVGRGPSPSNSHTMRHTGAPFNHSAQLGINPSSINPNFGGLAQQATSVGGQPRGFNQSQPPAPEPSVSNPLAGLPQFMTGNGSGLSLPPNTGGLSSMGLGVGSVGRALQGHALRPPPRDNSMDPNFFSANDHQQQSAAQNSAPDMSMAPLGHMNPDEAANRRTATQGSSTVPQIDNLFQDGSSFGDGNAPIDFGF